MPYCFSSNGIRIFYRRYGHGSTKVLLIIGLAGTHDSWGPQVKGLAGTNAAGNDGGEGIEVCCFDNRGMGRSSVPANKSDYSTSIMAKDALALLDHLGWKEAHVFGHSMGSMIACKLAALAPNRLSSLALLNATGGGIECFPKVDLQILSLAFRFFRAKTPEQRAAVDLEAHFTKEYLDEYIGSSTRRMLLYQEYVRAISSTGLQSNHGFDGQVSACWTHKMTPEELNTIRKAGFLVSIIHGRDDIIAQIGYARRLAERLYPAARMVELHGAHLVGHERPEEVNLSLMELIEASESDLLPQEWSNVPQNESGWLVLSTRSSLTRTYRGLNWLVLAYSILVKLMVYFFAVFFMLLEHAKKAPRFMRPVRVASSISQDEH